MEEYLAVLRAAGRAESTLRRYRAILSILAERGAVATLGDDLAPATRLLRHKVITTFGRWAERAGYDLGGMGQSVPRPRLEPAVPRALPAEDLERVGAAVARSPLRTKALFTLILECGLREAEACALRVRDVDVTTRGQEGVRVRGKGSKERFVPLPAGYRSRALLKRLIGRRAPDEFVFSARTGLEPSTSGVRKAWARICAAAGVQGYSVHCLRHTAATRMLERTQDLQLVSRLLGHSSVSVTARYTLRTDVALRRAMETAGGGWQR